MRPIVTRVESNIKTGCAVDLGPRTLIVGPNGSGKSTIVNAVELALTGRASDIAGRATLALDAELWTLAPPSAEAIGALAQFDRGGEAEWSLDPGHRARLSPAARPGAFPLREVREALTGSPERARKWLLGRLAGAVGWPAAAALLPAQLQDRAAELAGGTVAGLPAALEAARSRARDAAKRAELLRASARSSSVGLAPGTDPHAIGTAQRALHEAEAALAALPPDPAGAELAALGGAALALLDAQIDKGAVRCGACGTPTAPEAARARRAAIAGQIAGAERRERERSRTAAVVEAARAELERLRAAQADGDPWGQIKAQESRAVEEDRTAAEWRELADALATTIGRLVNQARVAFESRVGEFLPPGDTFHLDLEDGDREVCRIGLLSDGGHMRSALSGAEWARVTAAIAAVTLPEGDGPAIVVPEERAWDPATLTAALRAFGAIPAQVIVTSTIEPLVIPEGWTVIRTGSPAVEPPAPRAVEEPRPRATRPPPPPGTHCTCTSRQVDPACPVGARVGAHEFGSIMNHDGVIVGVFRRRGRPPRRAIPGEPAPAAAPPAANPPTTNGAPDDFFT